VDEVGTKLATTKKHKARRERGKPMQKPRTEIGSTGDSEASSNLIVRLMDSDEQEGQKRKNLGHPEAETGMINVSGTFYNITFPNIYYLFKEVAEEDVQMEDAAEGTSESKVPKKKKRVRLMMGSDDELEGPNLGHPESETGIVNVSGASINIYLFKEVAEEDVQMEEAAEGTSESKVPTKKKRVRLMMDSDDELEGPNLGQPESKTGIVNVSGTSINIWEYFFIYYFNEVAEEGVQEKATEGTSELQDIPGGELSLTEPPDMLEDPRLAAIEEFVRNRDGTGWEMDSKIDLYL
jgi:hypothetical protein